MKRECGRWGHKLRNHGLKCTQVRELILEILSSTKEHLSPEEIYENVRDQCIEAGLTTVYRALDMYVKLGIVNKLDFGDGKSRYELSENLTDKKHHHHLFCTSCGKIVDYSDLVDEESDTICKIEGKLSKKFNFKITGHFIKFEGICFDCLNR